MAIVQTGSILSFSVVNNANTGTVSSTITVPADAELVIVGVSGYQGTANGFAGMTFTKGGTDTAMVKATGGDNTNSFWQAAMFYLALPDTGTNKSLKWDWTGTGVSSDPDMLISVSFWKGVDTTTPVRDSDGSSPGGSMPHTTPTLTAQSGDKIVAFCSGYITGGGSAQGTINSWSNLTLLENVVHDTGGTHEADGAWATGDPTGNTTVAASTSTNMAEGAIVAVVLQPPAAPSTTLTVSDLGNGVSASASASVATGATITAAVGDMLVVLVAASNDGTNGVSSLTGVVDSDGVNVYTERAHINYDPGAAGVGATLGIYTCLVTSALSGDTITANFSPNTAQKAIQVYKCVPPAGRTAEFVAADTTGVTGNLSTYAAATVSVTLDHTIFGAAAIETDDAVTGDTDTTNGSWSSILTRLADGGADASTMSIASQWKTVTATGNQSWAATTVTARDAAISYVVLQAVAEDIIRDATLARTLGAVTSTSASKLEIKGSSARTLGAITSTGSVGKVQIKATSASTLGSITGASVTELEIKGSTARTLNAVTQVSAATLQLKGSTAKVLDPLTSNSASTLQLNGSLDKTLGAVTTSSASTLFGTGTLSRTLDAIILSSTASAIINTNGSLAKTLDAITSVSLGAMQLKGSTSATLGSISVSTAATLLLKGSSALTPDAISTTSAAITTLGGTLSRTLGNITASSVGALLIKGSLNKTLDDVTLDSEGIFLISTTGSLDKTLDPISISAAAKLSINAASSKTLDAIASTSASDLIIKGSSARTLNALTLVSATKLGLSATSAKTLDAVQTVSAAITTLGGTLQRTLGEITSQSAGTTNITATSARTLGAVTVVSEGVSVVSTSANLSVTLGTLGLTFAGVTTLRASASLALAALGRSSTGTLAIKGTSGRTLSPIITVSASTLPINGTLGASLGSISALITGTLVVKGSSSVALGSLGIDATATIQDQPPILADADLTLSPLGVISSGVLGIKGTLGITLSSIDLESEASGPIIVPPENLAVVAAQQRILPVSLLPSENLFPAAQDRTAIVASQNRIVQVSVTR